MLYHLPTATATAPATPTPLDQLEDLRRKCHEKFHAAKAANYAAVDARGALHDALSSDTRDQIDRVITIDGRDALIRHLVIDITPDGFFHVRPEVIFKTKSGKWGKGGKWGSRLACLWDLRFDHEAHDWKRDC